MTREIELARATADPVRSAHLQQAAVSAGGGNFLAALGLLCFTEYCGWLLFNRVRSGRGPVASANFNEFFDYLGPDYAALRTRHNVYDLFRCGLAHNYFAKPNDYGIYMLDQGSANVGIIQDAAGRDVFVVERYLKDLVQALGRLDRDLAGQFPLNRP